MERCRRCGAPFCPELEVVERIPSEAVLALVTRWPDAAAIEVRRCRCGQVFARKERRSRAPAVPAT